MPGRHRSVASSAEKSAGDRGDMEDVEMGARLESGGDAAPDENTKLKERQRVADDFGNSDTNVNVASRDGFDEMSCFSSRAPAPAPKSLCARGCMGRICERVQAFLLDIFRSEMDFDTAYTHAQARTMGLSNSMSRTETGGTGASKKYLHLCPLRFRDRNLETEYGQICGHLFIGRDFLVLCFTTFVIIPVAWYLGSYCFDSIELRDHSSGAWIAFHAACAVNLGVSLGSLLMILFPGICSCTRGHYESFSYILVFLWMSVLMVVMATFPKLVTAPEPRELLFGDTHSQLAQEVVQLAPPCRVLRGNQALGSFVESVGEFPENFAEEVQTCVRDPTCLSGAFELVSLNAKSCRQQYFFIKDQRILDNINDALWLPFAMYITYIKRTLHVFKVPIIALALIIIHFGTGMMFMDSLSPSRTKLTVVLHVIVVPICALPFIILQSTYPTIIPVQEAMLFFFSFTFVALAGYAGRYAQEFQHRLLICTWRVTSKRLSALHDKIKQQKKQKKSSTAVEELISQVKECQGLCAMARSRGRRADVMEELVQMEKLLEGILETLTQTDNLYSVKFTDDARTNEVQRQFIELYHNPDKRRPQLIQASTLKGAQKRLASAAPDSLWSSINSGGLQAISSQMSTPTGDSQGLVGPKGSATGPVMGLEFSSGFDALTSVHDSGSSSLVFKTLPMPEQTNLLLTTVGIDWDFDMLKLSQETENIIVEVGYALLCRLVTDWGCEDVRLIRFLTSIQSQYLTNPYHNKIHGAEVAHLTECLTRMLNAQRNMNSVDKVTLTVASICHDVGHPGRNNQFFINAFDPLAVIYNDIAVLENFHSCLTFRTLENKECNIFSNLEDSDFRYVRQYLIECILATDMKQHFESISRFRIRRSSPEFNYVKNVEDRWLVARMCVKVADIGHSSVPWPQHFDWSCRVVEEFYLQGDEERAKGMAVSPLCDREKHMDMAKSQGGFLEFVVKPLIKELEEIDPFGRVAAEISANIEINTKKWTALQAEGVEIQLTPHTALDGAEKNTVTMYAVRRIAGLRGHPKRTLPASNAAASGPEDAKKTEPGRSRTMLHTVSSVPDVIRKHLAEPDSKEGEHAKPDGEQREKSVEFSQDANSQRPASAPARESLPSTVSSGSNGRASNAGLNLTFAASDTVTVPDTPRTSQSRFGTFSSSGPGDTVRGTSLAASSSNFEEEQRVAVASRRAEGAEKAKSQTRESSAASESAQGSRQQSKGSSKEAPRVSFHGDYSDNEDSSYESSDSSSLRKDASRESNSFDEPPQRPKRGGRSEIKMFESLVTVRDKDSFPHKK
ncbi:3'5'-cyclic nucleotide phosphodiesterase domain-containing protein [Besnoitia besnoiti]|uniref:Phosphodiesterase n=1 Tax=Besnoitia besnoiti TaxID=94643 RepID=A0A2A9MIS0_BESBE|nr:3'5'-cyclic nucleotide phosphodiesterase domain-containing protein [Besnoitia besnoiti]PFH35300.1 3'5'-cyclic nucleotide phosphodiesterase domain-containing protein [Besnoitia besnoiti]